MLDVADAALVPALLAAMRPAFLAVTVYAGVLGSGATAAVLAQLFEAYSQVREAKSGELLSGPLDSDRVSETSGARYNLYLCTPLNTLLPPVDKDQRSHTTQHRKRLQNTRASWEGRSGGLWHEHNAMACLAIDDFVVSSFRPRPFRGPHT